MKQLVLFDIDGTLVDVRGAGRRAFISALKETWGIDDGLADVKFNGGTDLGVLQHLRTRLSLPAEKDRDFFRALEVWLMAELLQDKPSVYRGVQKSLARWQNDVDAVLGFVTGNAMRCAHLKVEHAGIDRSCFDVGGYGDEHPDRRQLAALAVQRAQQARGHAFDRTLLIGDTPNDVVAAKAIGAIAVGVTTGHFDRQALIRAGADVVVDSLDQLN